MRKKSCVVRWLQDDNQADDIATTITGASPGCEALAVLPERSPLRGCPDAQSEAGLLVPTTSRWEKIGKTIQVTESPLKSFSNQEISPFILAAPSDFFSIRFEYVQTCSKAHYVIENSTDLIWRCCSALAEKAAFWALFWSTHSSGLLDQQCIDKWQRLSELVVSRLCTKNIFSP